MTDPNETAVTKPAALKPGIQTSEGKIAHVIATLGALTSIAGTVSAYVPSSSPAGVYLAIGGIVVSAMVQGLYGFQRTWLKIAALKNGATP